MIDVKSEITYLLVVDYLTRMAADQVISEKELDKALELAAIEYKGAVVADMICVL